MSIEIKSLPVEENSEQIIAFLQSHVSEQPFELQTELDGPVSLAAYEGEEQVGGLLGKIFWNQMELSLLATNTQKRKLGIGSKLLQTAEEIARKKGCTYIVLETMSWQAPKFYQKHGFTIFGQIDDYPIPGETKYYLHKKLN